MQEMILIEGFILLSVAGIIAIPFAGINWKGAAALSALTANVLISCYLALLSLEGNPIEILLPGSMITGAIPLRLDALSAWFILIINLVYLTGGIYGLHYMKQYRDRRNAITMQSMAFLLSYAALISICVIQHFLAFLIAWEIMTISAFLLVIFEHKKSATVKAGTNFLIQSHISVLFLLMGFLWVAHKTGSYDFNAITTYASSVPQASSLFLFFIFFTGFAIKAGFVPFHTWLPYAHPAAPAHVSGIMSGVIIKIGIYGMLRMILLITTDHYAAGIIILAISLVTGLYGVMLAIIQHNLKRLLAYHSIENIGIIGLGMALGCIGLGTGNGALAALGFAGALLHTLNHALFKSLLFYTAGNVYQATHTMDIERMGGLVRRMPQTTALFLIASVAICGLPPLNGFISEFLIYTGLYKWMGNASFAPIMTAIVAIPGLVLIGGFALICFTKAFGVVFLGTERQPLPDTCTEAGAGQLAPLYVIAGFIVFIGVFPGFIIRSLAQAVEKLAGPGAFASGMVTGSGVSMAGNLSKAAWLLILMVVAVYGIRKFVMRQRPSATAPTWGCGYPAPTPRQQYTAGSFVRSYSKLFQFILMIHKEEAGIRGVFPGKAGMKTHPYDKIEKYLIDLPLKANKSFMGRFAFLNNGRLQFYILYGIIFIITILSIPLIYRYLESFVGFLIRL
jgi:formate hydrogenlyase subunit 3/multisubunit Na+/H+ antiporter MnhD subunit